MANRGTNGPLTVTLQAMEKLEEEYLSGDIRWAVLKENVRVRLKHSQRQAMYQKRSTTKKAKAREGEGG